MAEPYPLDALMSVRLFREETAKRDVTIAQSRLREARETAEVRRKELADWEVWHEEEVERRYDAIMNRPTTTAGLAKFHQGLAKLADEGLARSAAVAAADEAASACEKKVADAKAAVRTARQNTAKIEAHKAVWSEESKKEAERAEEREFEDFKPVNRFGAAGDES